MRDLMAQVERVATSETRVCVRGETGTGKELIARTLHDKSPRFAGPFISLNCAAIPAELIESEFFPAPSKNGKGNGVHKLQEVPPVQGARLGRDKEGNPAWFITDPNRPGKYLQVN